MLEVTTPKTLSYRQLDLMKLLKEQLKQAHLDHFPIPLWIVYHKDRTNILIMNQNQCII